MKLISSSMQQARFLAAFAVCGQVCQASRWCKLNRNSHYGWMRDDPSYPARFADAEKRALRTLRDEAVRRARDGLRKAVWYKGKVVGYETEYSDTLLATLLKSLDPEFRDKTESEVKLDVNVDIRAAILRAISDLPQDTRSVVARKLLAIGGPPSGSTE